MMHPTGAVRAWTGSPPRVLNLLGPSGWGWLARLELLFYLPLQLPALQHNLHNQHPGRFPLRPLSPMASWVKVLAPKWTGRLSPCWSGSGE